MKEAFEKIRKRLEDEKLTSADAKAEAIIGMQGASANYYGGELRAFGRAIQIVSEVEAEYTKNIMAALLEAKKNCGEDSDCSQCPFGCEDGCSLQALQITGGNNGWIPVEKALPKERDWYLAMFKEPDTGFMGLPFIADYLMGVHTKYTTEDGWIIANCTDIEDERAKYYKKLVCVAWMPLPSPYKPTTD